MLSSLLSLPIESAAKLDDYSITKSTGVSQLLVDHYKWTSSALPDADRSSSLLQAQWLSQRARDLAAKRVLDIGCYTGLSAIAFFEATRDTEAQIDTIEHDAKLAALARQRFQDTGCSSRVSVLEGDAMEILGSLKDQYDFIFVDLEFSMYLPTVQRILERRLLSDRGIILVDNVFARGFVVEDTNFNNVDEALKDHWVRSGQLVRDFNDALIADVRVSTIILPFFDGVSEIRWRH